MKMRIRVFVLFLCVLGFASISSAQILSQILQTQPSSSGSFSFVQKSADFTAGTTSPASLTLNGTASGHLIVVMVHARVSTAGSFSVSDGVNTYTAASGVCQNATELTEAFYVLSGAGGNLTISVSFSGTVSRLYANAREYSSTTPVTFIGRACTASPASTTTPTSDAVNANGTNNLLVGGLVEFTTSSSSSCGSGWGNCSLSANQSTTIIADTEDQLNVANGNYSSTFNISPAASDWMAEAAAFKD